MLPHHTAPDTPCVAARRSPPIVQSRPLADAGRVGLQLARPPILHVEGSRREDCLTDPRQQGPDTLEVERGSCVANQLGLDRPSDVH
eukprot:10933664-Alexandrium_andersonii.AAC.1